MARHRLGSAPWLFAATLVTTAPVHAADDTALRLANTPSATGYMRVAHHGDFVMQNFTLEAWVQRVGTGFGMTTDPTGSGILSKPRENVCGSNIASWHLDYSNTGQIMLNITHAYSSSGLYLQSPSLPEPLARHHLAVTFDGDSAKIFVDGARIAAAAWTLGTVYYGTESILIGANNWACGYLRGFDGFIDDVRIWNYARTGDDIATWRSCRLSGTETGLMGYWTFEGSDLVDQTGRGHYGSFSGTATSFAALAPITTCTVGVEDQPALRATDLAMSLHPIPARDRVQVSFHLPRSAPVTIDVWDVAGRRLATWEAREYSAGRHEVVHELASLLSRGSSGVRFVRLRAGDTSVVKTLITTR